MDWPVFLIFLAACGAAAATGAMFKPGPWYDGLAKPSWNPPNWVFPVTWTVLYILIAAAGARLSAIDGSGTALAFWALQIALNTLWSPVFFGLHRIRAGMLIIVALWGAVLGLLICAFPLDALAGWMLAPYLVWVSIAASLNAGVWKLNPDQVARAS